MQPYVGVTTDRQTDRQKDASNFTCIICPMLCFSNGTDSKNYFMLTRTGCARTMSGTNQDMDNDFTYNGLYALAAKPTIAIKQRL